MDGKAYRNSACGSFTSRDRLSSHGDEKQFLFTCDLQAGAIPLPSCAENSRAARENHHLRCKLGLVWVVTVCPCAMAALIRCLTAIFCNLTDKFCNSPKISQCQQTCAEEASKRSPQLLVIITQVRADQRLITF